MAIPSITSLPRTRRRATYQRRPVVAEARHRGPIRREDRSWLYRASGTAMFWTLAVLAYCAAGAVLAGVLIALTTQVGRDVIAITAVVTAIVWGGRRLEGAVNR